MITATGFATQPAPTSNKTHLKPKDPSWEKAVGGLQPQQGYSAYAPKPAAQPIGGTSGQAPNMPGAHNPMYARAPQTFGAPPAATGGDPMPTQTYGNPQGNYANMPEGQRPPAFQESAQTPFGTMSPQQFYDQRAGFVDNIYQQHQQNIANAGVFGADTLPQNSAPQWGNMADMWPGSDQYGNAVRQAINPQSPLGPSDGSGMMYAGGSPNFNEAGPNMPGVHNPMYSTGGVPRGDDMNSAGTNYWHGGVPRGESMLPVLKPAPRDYDAEGRAFWANRQREAAAGTKSVNDEINRRSELASRTRKEAGIASRKAAEPQGWATMTNAQKAAYQQRQAAASGKADQDLLRSYTGRKVPASQMGNYAGIIAGIKANQAKSRPV